MRLVFHHTDLPDIGWRAHVHSSGEVCLLTLPWTDQIDRVLVQRSETPPFGPGLGPDAVWEDVDRCWCAEVSLIGDHVYIAESEDVPPSPTPPSLKMLPGGRTGQVLINRVEAKISCVPRREWEQAWSAAQASCVAGSPEPAVRERNQSPAHPDS